MRSRIVMRQAEPPSEATENSLAKTLQKYMQESGRSIYELSNFSAVDTAYIWRIIRGEKENVSREVIIRLGVALVLDSNNADKVIETTNELLDAGGFKRLH